MRLLTEKCDILGQVPTFGIMYENGTVKRVAKEVSSEFAVSR
jgi:hypothetical protein